MKVFSQISESVANGNFALTQQEFDSYKAAIEKTKRSKEFTRLMWLVAQSPIFLDNENLQKVINGKFFKEVDETTQKDIQRIAKKIGDEVKILPQMLSAEQRKYVIDGVIDPNDLTLDLETPKGRDAIAKKYVPLVEKIVKQFMGKSNFDKEELRSSALVGLVNAMNDYKNPEEMVQAGKEGHQSFTQYAAYRIKQQIMKDMTEFGTQVKISNHYRKKLAANDKVAYKDFSMDQVFSSYEDGEPMSIDRFLGLSEEDDQFSYREKQELYKKMFKRIESKFSSRDCNMFYRVWGINGYKAEKVKDLAKEYGISAPAVTQACGRILKFAAADKEIQSYKDAFESLIEEYIFTKLFEVYSAPKQQIIESLIYDDLYVLIESINKWNSADKFQKAVNKATDHLNIDDALYIYKLIAGDLNMSTGDLKKYAAPIVAFLQNLYPEKGFKKSDIANLYTEMSQLADASRKWQIKW